jgi:hypothetical protein
MDPGLHDMHVRHQREMAVLRMEIDRARTAAELEQIKGMLNDLRRQQGGCWGLARVAGWL